ncbi:hypothetical protein ACNTMW_28615 [Planosporangium sp. 12N6]|uniref:hypothetical protein n=1 Tax=Planosporangium spinosum TaxID=3402278 RepID=UPI003CF7E8AE
MFVLLVLVLATAAVGIFLMISMFRRDQPMTGMMGLMILQAAGVMGTAYGVFTSA